MVPCEKIIQTAIEQQVDVIGLSGLITPSLDEMCSIAAEMQRAGLKIPILIGGATTSKIHTAVKIAPEYSAPAVYVKDASVDAFVAAQLINPATRESFIRQINAEYSQIRENQSAKSADKLLTLAEAKNRKPLL
jgi:5-methyltetrahydrofolate--homocysteine methyltransferase